MAEVLIDRRELEQFGLPPVCMCCGAPATVWKKKKFSYTPSWVWILLLAGILPLLIVSLIITERLTVAAPLCERHKNHWRWRTLAVVGGLVAILVFLVALTMLAASLEKAGKGDLLGGTFCLGGLALGTPWLVLAIVLQETSVRSGEINKRTLLVKGVAEEFRASFREYERANRFGDVDDEALKPFRPRQKPDSEDFYDPGANR
jgi:hypothetical protein